MRRTIATILLSALSLMGAEFLPLETGNSWTYRHRSGSEFTVRVGTPALLGGQVYYSLIGYADDSLLVRSDGVALYYLDQDSGQERLLTSFEPFEGGWWIAPNRLCTDDGQTLLKRSTHDGPAGPFPSVLDVRYRTYSCADAGLVSEQYAENIGMLRRVVQSFAGPRQYDLVRARVGRMTLEAMPNGRFTVSLNAPACAEEATVTLRLQNDPVLPLKLLFATGQELDIVLRDADGNVLFTWSDKKMFTQELREVTVAGEWVRTATIPNPAADCEGPSRTYTLEAWLTAEPRFAAAVPVAVP